MTATIAVVTMSSASTNLTRVAAQQGTAADLAPRAVRGDPDALFMLASMHDVGAGGLRKDPVEAARLLQRAADAGHVPSKVQLGRKYQTGAGVPQDAAKGRALFSAAAQSGSVEAQFHLALAWLDGLGGAKDPAEAQRWLVPAAKAGHQEAQLILGIMMQTGMGGQKNEFAARRLLRQAAAGPDTDLSQKADELATKIEQRLLGSSAFGPREAAVLFAISAGLAIMILGSDANSGGGVDFGAQLEKKRQRDVQRHINCLMVNGWWDGTVCHAGK
jgi:Sel1 repeat